MMFSWSIRNSHTPDVLTLLVLAALLMSAVPEHGISHDVLFSPATTLSIEYWGLVVELFAPYSGTFDIIIDFSLFMYPGICRL